MNLARTARLRRGPLVLLLSLGALACGGGNSDGPGGAAGGAAGAWEPLGERFFSGVVANNYSIEAGSGVVSVGYWDVSLGKPCVRQFDASGDTWEYVGGGPVPVDGLALDPLAYTSFQFRRAGVRSVVGFNRSLAEPEFVLFAADGAGGWEQLPSVPLSLLPGYADGFTGFPEQDFRFTVTNEAIYALVHDEESTYPDEKTCLSVFVFADGAWSLLPDRICHPQVSDGFAWETSFGDATIHVAPSGKIYLGFFRREDATSLLSVGVAMHDGTGWTTLADSTLFPIGTSSYATSRFGMRVFSDGADDTVALAVGGDDDEAHVFVHRAGAWAELPSPGVPAGPSTHLAVAFDGRADRVVLAHEDGPYGVTVKRHAGDSWVLVGERRFTEEASEFYDDVIAADGGALYLVSQTSLDRDGEATRGTLAVYRSGP